MAIFNQKCSNCGAEASKDAQFCPNCGQRLGGGTRRCGKCGTENRGSARFCRNCGSELDANEIAEVQRHRWARHEGDFAARVVADDLSGLLKRGINVQQGTNAMIVEHGANRGMIPPGEHTLDTLGQRFKDWITGSVPKHATAVLVNIIPTDLEFHLGGRFTSDPLPIGVSVRMQVQVEEPARFLVNVLGDRERLSVEDLRQYLYPEVTQLADRWLRQHTLDELVEDPQQRARFELALEEALRTTLAQTGLKFIQVRTVELNLEPYDAITGQRAIVNLMDRQLAADVLLAEAKLRAETQKVSSEGEANLQLKDLQADYDLRKERLDLEIKKEYDQLKQEKDLQELVVETNKVENEERLVELYQRMRQAVMSDKMNEVRSEAEFAAFLDDLDRQKLLREKERADMLKLWTQNSEDLDSARAHMLAKLERERNFELHKIDLMHRSELTEEQLQADLRIERQRVDGQEAIEYARVESRLRRQKMEEDYRREQRKLDEIAERERQLQDALNQARIRADEREEDRLDAEMGILILEKMKAVRRKDEFERDLHALEVKEKELEIDLRRQEVEIDLKIREMREKHAQEMESRQKDQDFELTRIERLQAFGKAGAVILANPEQARMIKELSETETMAGMSPEAIMARVSERSPEAAKAYAEIMSSKDTASKAEMEKLYGRLYEQLQDQLRQQNEYLREQRESQRDQAKLQKDMYDKGMDTAAQIAREVSQASHQGPAGPQIVVVPSGGGVPQGYPSPAPGAPSSPSTGPTTKTCPRCSKTVSIDAHYCEHCQYEFPG